jgi:hypothetical protein
MWTAEKLCTWQVWIIKSGLSFTLQNTTFNIGNLISSTYIKYSNFKYIKKLSDIIQQRKTQHKRLHIIQTNLFIWFLHASPDFFVCPSPYQIFSNIFEKSYERNVQLDWFFGIVLTKYWEHGSHIVLVPKFHLGKLNASIWANRWTSILNTVHPPCVFVVEATVDLVQLILQPIQHDIISNPEQIGFPVV